MRLSVGTVALAVVLVLSVTPTAGATDAADFEHTLSIGVDSMEFEKSGWSSRLVVSEGWDIRYGSGMHRDLSVSFSASFRRIGYKGIDCTAEDGVRIDHDETNAMFRRDRGTYVNATFSMTCHHTDGLREQFDNVTVVGWWRIPTDAHTQTTWKRWEHWKWGWQYPRTQRTELGGGDVGLRIFGAPYDFPTTGFVQASRQQFDQWQSDMKFGWEDFAD